MPGLSESTRKIALAVARATLPAGAHFAGADARTVEKTEAFLNAFGPIALPGWMRLLTVLEHATRLTHRGMPFSKLDRDEAERVLASWADGDPARAALAIGIVSPVKGAYFDDPVVYKKLASVYAFEARAEQPAWRRKVTRGAELDDTELECDVVVIGTGAGGAVVAKELAARGHAVLMLEEGDYHARNDFGCGSFEAFHRFYREHATIGGLGNTFIPIPMGRLVGGSTAVNTATCWRTPDRVLHKWVDKLGLSELTPEHMAPYFDRVWEELDIGPTDRKYLGGPARVVARGCDVLGYSHRPVDRNAKDCDGSGVCDAGCPTGAKRSMDTTYVPRALQLGAELWTGVRAEKLRIENNSVVGVEGTVRATKKKVRVRARATILAGGAIPSPIFLQHNRVHEKLPAVGKNLSIHPATTVSALFNEEIRGYAAVPQGYCVDELHDEGILLLGASAPVDLGALQVSFVGRKLMEVMESYDRVASFGVMVEDRSVGRVTRGPGGRPNVLYWLGREERARLLRGVEATCRIFLAAGAREVWPALRGHRVIRDANDLRRLSEASPLAGDFLMTAFHPLGSCRMARSAREGVVDMDHEVFGLPGLFICDGSAVPTSVAVNPQCTIMAMSVRAAERIDRRLA